MYQIYVWADGTWCEAEHLSEMSHMSDDYITLDVGYHQDPDAVVSIYLQGA